MSELQFELYLRLLGRFLRLTPGQQAEIADELRDHLDARLEELSRAGIARDVAIRRALDEFGDAAQLADHFSRITRDRKKRLVMRCTLGTVAAAAAALVFGSALWPEGARLAVAPAASVAEDLAPAEGPRGSRNSESVRDRHVREKLESTTVECQFLDAPLVDVLTHLGEKLAVDLYAPRAEFEGELNSPITLHLKHTQPSARTVLELALRQAQLAYLVRDGIVMVCRPETAQEIRVYHCGGLQSPSVEPSGVGERSGAAATAQASPAAATRRLSGTEALQELISEVVGPETWVGAGGASQIRALDERLIVRAAPETHREIEVLLEQLAATKTVAR